MTSLRCLTRCLKCHAKVRLSPPNKPFPTRNSSFYGAVQSLAQTQAAFFKTISESAPVGHFQNMLLTVHEYSGLPWWATIIGTTVALRTAITLPLAIHQYYIVAKIENLNLEMAEIAEELKKEMAVAVPMFKWDEKTAKRHYKRALKKQWNNLIVRDNCHPFKAGLLLWFQIPLWLCFSVSLRNLVNKLPVADVAAEITVLELSVGGFGWVHNLLAPDPTLILPVTMGLANLAIIELQVLSKVRVPTKMQSTLTNFFRAFSVGLILVAANAPSCLTLYWATSSVYGLVQNVVLISPKVRRFCRIPQTPSELENPYQQVLLGLKYKLGLKENTQK